MHVPEVYDATRWRVQSDQNHQPFRGYLCRDGFHSAGVSRGVEGLDEKQGGMGRDDEDEDGKMTGWCFQIFFIFTPIWGRFPF